MFQLLIVEGVARQINGFPRFQVTVDSEVREPRFQFAHGVGRSPLGTRSSRLAQLFLQFGHGTSSSDCKRTVLAGVDPDMMVRRSSARTERPAAMSVSAINAPDMPVPMRATSCVNWADSELDIILGGDASQTDLPDCKSRLAVIGIMSPLL